MRSWFEAGLGFEAALFLVFMLTPVVSRIMLLHLYSHFLMSYDTLAGFVFM